VTVCRDCGVSVRGTANTCKACFAKLPSPASGPADPQGRAQLREHEVLVLLRYWLDEPARWTQGARARDRTGAPCEPTAVAAASWSLDGAIAWVFGSRASEAMTERERSELRAAIVSRLAHAMGRDGVYPNPTLQGLIHWHERPERAHGEVLKVLDRARKDCEVNGG